MKHAYMIIAHNEFDILKKLIRMIDDERNDIYIHIDKKVKDFNFDEFLRIPKKSKLIFTKRISVSWGGDSQMACEYILFNAAATGHYDNYHLLSGVDMPLVSQDTIHAFFDANQGKEFVQFQSHTEPIGTERIKYFYFFQRWNRTPSRTQYKIQNLSLKMQKKLKVNRLKHRNLEIRKGTQWISVTDTFMQYLIQNEKYAKRLCKYGFCVDELFIQTLMYNSPHYKNLYNHERHGCESIKRYIDWQRGSPYTFTADDFDLLINSGAFWCRKINQTQSGKLPDMIFNHVMAESKK